MARGTIGGIRGVLTVIVVLGSASAAHAQREPIMDRDYAIDLYQGTVIGSGKIIGMGGATVAIGEGSAGMLFNPAAAAVRPSTSNDSWDWDWHLDWLIPAPGSDHDNNGDATTEIDNTQVFTLGALLHWRKWALAFSASWEQHDFPITGGEGRSSMIFGRLALARRFADDRWTVGIATRSGTFSMGRLEAGVERELFSITGSSLEGGVIWRPRKPDIRVGATVAFPVTGEEVQATDCDPMDCEGYILPERVAVPWVVAVGVGWRRAPSVWNQQIQNDWRDEQALTVAADLVVTGRVDGGAGIEAFTERELQRSGQSVVASVRVGAEYEWLPGRLRVRAGSYWEPERFEGEGGRLHFTGGLEWRFWSFCFWDDRYRLRLSLTVDGAAEYGNGGVSVGLWH